MLLRCGASDFFGGGLRERFGFTVEIGRSRICAIVLDVSCVDEAHDPAGSQQLDQRPAWDAQAGTDSDHREPFASARPLVAPGQLVGQRPTDPQHLGGLLDRQQERVVPKRELELPNDAHEPYLHSCDSERQGASALLSEQISMIQYTEVNGGTWRSTTDTLL